MHLRATDKAKLATAAAVLILVLGVPFLYWRWTASSQTDSSHATMPTTSPTASPAAEQQASLRQFLQVVQSDDTAKAMEMLNKNPALAKADRAEDGATALHLARSVAMAKLLLDNSADLNARDTRYFARPLRWAAAELMERNAATPELIRFLESKGAAEPDIIFAVAVGDLAQMAKLLASDSSLLDERSDDQDVLFGGCTPLQIAAYFGQLDAAKMLIQSGADIHDRSGWNNTEPLEKAAWTGHADVVALLLDHGAKVDGTDQDFTHSPLYNAAKAGQADVVKILLAHGAAMSPALIPAVRKAMQNIGHNGPAPGTPAEYQRVLTLLGAPASTQSAP